MFLCYFGPEGKEGFTSRSLRGTRGCARQVEERRKYSPDLFLNLHVPKGNPFDSIFIIFFFFYFFFFFFLIFFFKVLLGLYDNC